MPGLKGNDLLYKIFTNLIQRLLDNGNIAEEFGKRMLETKVDDFVEEDLRLLEEVRDEFFPLIVFFSSDDADEEVTRQARVYGAKYWIIKPFQPETFAQLVQKAIGR